MSESGAHGYICATNPRPNSPTNLAPPTCTQLVLLAQPHSPTVPFPYTPHDSSLTGHTRRLGGGDLQRGLAIEEVRRKWFDAIIAAGVGRIDGLGRPANNASKKGRLQPEEWVQLMILGWPGSAPAFEEATAANFTPLQMAAYWSSVYDSVPEGRSPSAELVASVAARNPAKKRAGRPPGSKSNDISRLLAEGGGEILPSKRHRGGAK